MGNRDAADTVLECEVKMVLRSREDLQRMLAVLPRPRRWGMQLNCYLDTADGDLAAGGGSLRVRITPDHARLTFKLRRGVEGAAFLADETEIAVDRAQAVAWVRAEAPLDLSARRGFGAAALLVAGRALSVSNWSLTRRAICDTPEGVTVEVDETVFPDGFRDFEVEAEHEDPDLALGVIAHYAGRAGITLGTQSMTKHARADAHRGNRPLPVPEGDPSGAMPDGLDEDPGL